MIAPAPRSQSISSPLHSPSIVFWGAVVLSCLLIVFGASGGVRGTDQYWYLADLTTLMQGGPHTNNTLFPRQLLLDGLERSPFIHDILVQYLAVPFAWIAGPYWGWIAMNLAAVVITACLTRRAIAMSTDDLIAARLSAWMVLLPIHIHQGCQMLSETACMPFFAATFLLIQRADRPRHWLLISGLVVLMFMCRFTHICILLTIPFLTLTLAWPVRRRIATFSLSVAIMAIGHQLNRILFTGVILTGGGLGAAVRTHSMTLAYNGDNAALTVRDVIDKVLFSLGCLMAPPLTNQANLAVNYLLFLLAIAGAFIAWKRKDTPIALIILATVAMNVATLLLFQNQFRYVLPSIPLLIAAAALLLTGPASILHRSLHTLFPWVTCALVASGIFTALHDRQAGIREASERSQFALFNKDMQGAGDLLSVDHELFILSYVVNPRVTLFTQSSQPKADWDRILAMPRWRWVFCSEGETALFDQRRISLKPLRRLVFRGTPCALYEIVPPPQPAPQR